MTLLSIACAMTAVALLLPASSVNRVPVGRREEIPARPKSPSVHWTPSVLLLGGAVLVFVVDGRTLVLGLITLCAVGAAARLLASRRREQAAAALENRVLEACELLVGELAAGQPSSFALERCVEVCPELAPVATASRLGADVPTALRRAASVPGALELGTIASAWHVAEASGSGLAAALDQVAISTRESQATSRLVAGELASARATARLVAVLPVATLVMGAGLGGDPWGFLLRTPAGLACLAVGLVLAFAGLVWIDRIAARVMSP